MGILKKVVRWADADGDIGKTLSLVGFGLSLVCGALTWGLRVAGANNHASVFIGVPVYFIWAGAVLGLGLLVLGLWVMAIIKPDHPDF